MWNELWKIYGGSRVKIISIIEEKKGLRIKTNGLKIEEIILNLCTVFEEICTKNGMGKAEIDSVVKSVFDNIVEED